MSWKRSRPGGGGVKCPHPTARATQVAITHGLLESCNLAMDLQDLALGILEDSLVTLADCFAEAAGADRIQESRSLEMFLGDLQTLWRTSQLRHHPPQPRTGKRSRPDPFEADMALIECWLQE